MDLKTNMTVEAANFRSQRGWFASDNANTIRLSSGFLLEKQMLESNLLHLLRNFSKDKAKLGYRKLYSKPEIYRKTA